MSNKTALVAFDFDHTIIDNNSDLYVRKLAPNGEIPPDIKKLYTAQGWTDYMAAIFQYLHRNGTTPTEIIDCMKEIEFVKGMHPLFQYLSQDCFDVIIISDANSVFIDSILKAADLDHVVSKVYTNPASFNSHGCLTLEYYHTQDWCDLSTVNLCKGQILEEHMLTQAQEGKEFDLVAYVGDGTNDICPALKLKRKQDLVFPRSGFPMMEKLPKYQDQLTAQVVEWETGQDILRALKETISKV